MTDADSFAPWPVRRFDTHAVPDHSADGQLGAEPELPALVEPAPLQLAPRQRYGSQRLPASTSASASSSTA
jgi:hypothetical protein